VIFDETTGSERRLTGGGSFEDVGWTPDGRGVT
jgi:hypothetical protein